MNPWPTTPSSMSHSYLAMLVGDTARNSTVKSWARCLHVQRTDHPPPPVPRLSPGRAAASSCKDQPLVRTKVTDPDLSDWLVSCSTLSRYRAKNVVALSPVIVTVSEADALDTSETHRMSGIPSGLSYLMNWVTLSVPTFTER